MENGEQLNLWEKWKELLYELITSINNQKKSFKDAFYNIIITKEWAIFMTFARIGTFILVAGILYVLIKEIDAVKLLGTDACRVCMNKTGATCFINDLPPWVNAGK